MQVTMHKVAIFRLSEYKDFAEMEYEINETMENCSYGIKSTNNIILKNDLIITITYIEKFIDIED